ncbi:MAG: hypothetical protein HY960_03995 [Ignavibacteriae bacterium]|nr:hypothetical protein [Ignavibacteriota bacterium]
MKHLILIALTLSIITSASFAQLTVAASDGGVDGVLRGITYTLVYDPFAGTSTVSPNNNGEAPNGDVGVDISGNINSNVTVEMSLPDHLLGSGGTSMAITFPSSGPGSGVRVETAGFFNPNITNTFNLGGGGTSNLRLGYTFTVPPNTNISGDAMVGQILINVYYTGL